MASGGMKCVLFSANDNDKAITNISSQGGVVGLELSPGRIYGAVVPDTYEENYTDGTDYQAWLDTASDIISVACETLKGSKVNTIERPVPFTKKGNTAVAVLLINGEADDDKLTVDELSKEVLPALYQGALSLASSYPNDNVTMTFDPQYIDISESSKVPHVGLTAWPSA
eukprot:c21425_g1_i1 orf=1-507(-)